MASAPTLHCKIDTSSNLSGRFGTTSNLKSVISSDGSITAKFSLPTQGVLKMTCTPTLHFKIDTSSNLSGRFGTTSNLKANFSSNGSISAEFSLPSQVEAEHYAESYDYTPTFHEQVLPTTNKLLDSDIHFHSIQTYETSNEYGTTFII